MKKKRRNYANWHKVVKASLRHGTLLYNHRSNSKNNYETMVKHIEDCSKKELPIVATLDERKKLFIPTLIKNHGLVRITCNELGISNSQFELWMQDPDFRQDCLQMEDLVTEKIIFRIVDDIYQGKTSLLGTWYLKYRGGKYGFGDKTYLGNFSTFITTQKDCADAFDQLWADMQAKKISVEDMMSLAKIISQKFDILSKENEQKFIEMESTYRKWGRLQNYPKEGAK